MTKAECNTAAQRVAWALELAGLPATLAKYAEGFCVEVVSEEMKDPSSKQLVNIAIIPKAGETCIWIGDPSNRIGVPLERWRWNGYGV